MTKKEFLLDYLEVEDIDESFHEEYDDDDSEFEINGEIYLVLTEYEETEEIENYVKSYVADIKSSFEKSEFKHLDEFVNWDAYIENEIESISYSDICNHEYLEYDKGMTIYKER